MNCFTCSDFNLRMQNKSTPVNALVFPGAYYAILICMYEYVYVIIHIYTYIHIYRINIIHWECKV